jgi:hypothetical protein
MPSGWGEGKTKKKETGRCEGRPGAGGASGYGGFFLELLGYGGLPRVLNSYFIPRV